ncbi:hypothetical protein DWF00_16675 [Bosea caraganae]|uniref:Uncharacterized protein n=1 Tax=Bosea caraganae TaxID=2763117 RepID=A0A370KYT1_9HYPH|nr:hypothetical protein [Bosea caraganae]RDJ20143.1 hypothetical protein DWE98_26275 [Bosea caraganae]RDJ25244.1 hypothetical protein DWF00_16675 [Bosea caraganae]
MLLAFVTSLIPPLAAPSPAEAQGRSSARDVSRQNVRGARQVQRSHRGSRPQVNRSRGRSHVYRGRSTVRNHRPGRVVVVHPRRHWNRGGAVAAGAAIGFIAGASAVAIAGRAPRSGYCWFYTTPQRTTGFWDWCPR